MMTTAVVTRELRRASVADLPVLVRMFQQFVASTQYAKYVGQDPQHCSAALERFMASKDCAVFVAEEDEKVVGMVGGLVFIQPFSGERVATELFWWLDPEHRGSGVWLLRRIERWAKGEGAIRMSMMAPVDKPRVAEIYEAVGYTEVERTFQRDL